LVGIQNLLTELEENGAQRFGHVGQQCMEQGQGGHIPCHWSLRCQSYMMAPKYIYNSNRSCVKLIVSIIIADFFPPYKCVSVPMTRADSARQQ